MNGQAAPAGASQGRAEGHPQVSVVIPAYKAEAFLEETIESVRAQTWRPVEVVVVDDKSPDAGASVVERVAARVGSDDFAVRLIRRECNGGVTEAVNDGFGAAQGEYVCWLSADDMFVDPRKIERQIAEMRKGARFVYSTTFLQGESVENSIRVEGRWSHRFSSFIDPFWNRRVTWRVLGFMFGNPVSGSTVMMRKGLMDEFGGFDRFDDHGQNMDSDADLWMRLSALGVPFGMSAGVAVLYRIHPAQGSQTRVDEWVRDTQVTRARILLALDEIHKIDAVLNSAWPVLVFALRGRYRTFPQVAMAVCKYAKRPGVSRAPRLLARRMEALLIRESLWDEAAYADIMSRAEKAMESVVFKAFRARLAAGEGVGA